MINQINDYDNNIFESFRQTFSDENLFYKVVDLFPYPIQVFSIDGTSLMVNKAMLRVFRLGDADSHVGIYNVFKDPIMISLGLMDAVKEVLKGKTVHLNDVVVPYRDIARYYNMDDGNIEAMNQDITCFPLMGDDNNVRYIIATFITKNIYYRKKEVMIARKYMEDNWRERFNIDKIANEVNLSSSHLSRLFKKHIGITPHEYYINIKVNKIKEMLLNSDLTISEAFSACGVDYHGYYARLFKEKTGFTPTEYRELVNLDQESHNHRS